MQVTAKRGLGKKMTLGCKAGDVLLVAAIEKKRLQLSETVKKTNLLIYITIYGTIRAKNWQLF